MRTLICLLAFLCSTCAAVERAPADLDAVFTQLRADHQTALYYEFTELPKPIIALVAAESESAVMERFQHETDTLYRFNLTIVLSNKLRSHTTHGKESDVVAFLLGNLADANEWVRTETVWALRYTDLAVPESRIAPLLQDQDKDVRREARDTLIKLREKSAERF